MRSESDRRAMVAIMLSLAVYFVWMSTMAPQPAPLDPAAVLTTAESPETSPAGTPDTPSATGQPTSSVPTVTPSMDPPKEIPKIIVPERTLPLVRNEWSGSLNSAHGALTQLTLTGYRAPPTVTPIWTWAMGLLGDQAGGWEPYVGGEEPQQLLGNAGAYVMAGAGSIAADGPYLVRQDGDLWVASHTSPQGLEITKRYAPGPDPFTITVEVSFQNGTGGAVRDLWIGVSDEMSGSAGRFQNALRPVADVNEDVEHLDDLEDAQGTERVDHTGPVRWFGIGDRYFMSVLVPEDVELDRLVFDQVDEDIYGAFLFDPRPLDAGAERTLRFTGFLGPKDLDALKPVNEHLESAVEFGWFGFFARILLWLLKSFHGLVGNWGLAIMGLTLTIKLAFFPLTQKAFTSSKKMQLLQPKLKELKEKYKDNKELQTQATMKLFQENKVNPMGGCLPSLIQLPVWIALYNVMLYSVELYDTSFLYLKDLTEVDPYGVLPTAVAGLMFLQQRMMPMGGMDPAQQKMMRLMPLIFAVFMYSFPAGLVLYFSVNNTLTIIQQWIIYRDRGDDPDKGERSALAS